MNKTLAVTIMIAISTLTAGVAASSTDDKLVEYRKEVAAGDTLWDACAKVASSKDDVREVVYNTLKENHISNPGNVQPGTEIIIRVKELK